MKCHLYAKTAGSFSRPAHTCMNVYDYNPAATVPETLLPLCKAYINHIRYSIHRLHFYYSTCRREIKGNAGDFYEKKRTRHRPACAVSLILRVSGKEQKLKRAFAGSTAGTSIIAATSIFSVAGAAIKKKFVKTIWKNGFLTTLQKNWNAANWTVK